MWRAPSRHGNGKGNWYFRRGASYIPLRGELWSPEWTADYHAEVNGEPLPDRMDRGSSRTKKATFGHVIAAYKQTDAYKEGAKGTVATRNTQIRYITQTLKLADTPVASMKLAQLEAIIEARKAESVGSATQLLILFRALYERAIRMDIGIEGNVAKSVALPVPPKGEGRRDWSEDIILQYQRRHPVGTVARVALETFLRTGFRIGDACRVGWKDVKDGIIIFVTEKTKKKLALPLHPDLKAALDACPLVGKDTWIVGPRGTLSKHQLGRWFRRWCDEAGISDDYSAHGLRHTVARRLMDLDVSVEDAMTITGHADRRIFMHYAQKRDEARAAKRAMAIYAGASKERVTND